MKKRLLIAMFVVICMSLLVVVASAAAPIPQKPTLDVDFGTVTTIDGFTPPSQLYVNTDERVLLTDGEGNYVTYPTYYVTKDSTTFDMDFSKLNSVQSIQYSKESVVLLEVPEGISALTSRYFGDSASNFTKCLSVQIPGTVTDYSKQLFFRNMTVKIVEFLDGKTPVTLGDEMFGGDNTGGSRGTAVVYVKFPNNMVSIGKGTFYKNHAVKYIIMGKNCEKFDGALFNECFPENSDKFIYASEKFFANTDNIFSKMFGDVGQWNNKRINIKLCYTGSQEKAEAFVAAAKEKQSGYIFDNAHYFDASTYDYATQKVGGYNNISIIYNFGKCDAFYNGVHNTVKQNACVEACTNCGLGVIEHADAKAENVTLTYANGLGNAGVRNTVCTNAGCGYKLTEQTEAIFQTEGYSIPEDGRGELVICYVVDKALLAEYEKLNSVTYTYGVFAIAANNIENNEIINTDKVIMAEVERSYASFEMKLSGFETVEKKNVELAFGAYIKDKNGNIVYIQPGILNENEKYSFITYDTIYNKAA